MVAVHLKDRMELLRCEAPDNGVGDGCNRMVPKRIRSRSNPWGSSSSNSTDDRGVVKRAAHHKELTICKNGRKYGNTAYII